MTDRPGEETVLDRMDPAVGFESRSENRRINGLVKGSLEVTFDNGQTLSFVMDGDAALRTMAAWSAETDGQPSRWSVDVDPEIDSAAMEFLSIDAEHVRVMRWVLDKDASIEKLNTRPPLERPETAVQLVALHYEQARTIGPINIVWGFDADLIRDVLDLPAPLEPSDRTQGESGTTEPAGGADDAGGHE